MKTFTIALARATAVLAFSVVAAHAKPGSGGDHEKHHPPVGCPSECASAPYLPECQVDPDC